MPADRRRYAVGLGLGFGVVWGVLLGLAVGFVVGFALTAAPGHPRSRTCLTSALGAGFEGGQSVTPLSSISRTVVLPLYAVPPHS